MLSAVQYNTGRDEEGARSLAVALALAPDRDLPLAATSPMFSRVVADAKKALMAQAKGTLLVESTPSGAAVTLDGVPLGSSPLQVKDVPPGQHVWRVSLPSGDATGGMVEIAAGKSAKVAGQTQAKDPETKMLSTLSQNKIDAEVLASAKSQAAEAGADALLFGGVIRDGKDLALDSFLFAVGSGEVRRLPRLNFDAELLSAGMAFLNLAAQIKSEGPTKIGQPVKLPAQVTEVKLAGGTKVAEAKYGVQANKEAADVEPVIEAVTKEDKRKVPLLKKRP
jgi:hypothetical protein